MPRKYKRARKRYRNFTPNYGPKKEVKFYDETNTNGFAPANLAGTIWSSSLVNIPEGTEPSQRIGRKVHITGIGLSYFMILGATAVAADTSDNLRIILYQDRQANGAAAIPGVIIEPPVTLLAYRNLIQQNRFKILSDKTYALNMTTGTGVTNDFGSWSKVERVFVRVNEPVHFSNSTGNDAAIASVNFGILVISSNAAATMTIQSRVRYMDM